MLQALASGAGTMTQIFRATQMMEERIFTGDTTSWCIVRRLSQARRPLVTVSAIGSRGPQSDDQVQMTALGRDVLQGRADNLDLNGIDRWMGGVHLTNGRYRWNGDLLTESC